MREYPGAAQTKRNEDGMNGMDAHTRKHTQARYGDMAKEHEPAAANATRKGGQGWTVQKWVLRGKFLIFGIT